MVQTLLRSQNVEDIHCMSNYMSQVYKIVAVTYYNVWSTISKTMLYYSTSGNGRA